MDARDDELKLYTDLPNGLRVHTTGRTASGFHTCYTDRWAFAPWSMVIRREALHEAVELHERAVGALEGISEAAVKREATMMHLGKPDPRNRRLLAEALSETGETEREIAMAWEELNMPRLEQRQTAREHGQWWVIGYDSEDQRRTYAAVEAEGPGSCAGWDFQEC